MNLAAQSLRCVAIAALIYGCYAALLYFSQRTILYPGRGIKVDPQPTGYSASFTVTMLDTRSGKVEIRFLPAKISSADKSPALIFFHGNGEVIDFLAGQVDELRRLGIHVLLVEYPGYGRSEGAPTETSIVAAAVAAYDALARRPDVDPTRIIAFGRSIGGGPACALSTKRPLAALVLQSTFTSTRPFAKRFLLPGFLARDVFDNLSAVRSFSGPILVAHGRHDDIIPFSHGAELAKAGRNVRFMEMNCSHNDCPPDMDSFWRKVGEFLEGHKIL